jgi:hypothetical protein
MSSCLLKTDSVGGIDEGGILNKTNICRSHSVVLTLSTQKTGSQRFETARLLFW